jgi:hypothetical protein
VRLKLGKADEARQDYERCAEISKETPTGKICVRELTRLAQTPPVSVTGSVSSSSHAARRSPPASAAAAPQAPTAVNPNETRKM